MRAISVSACMALLVAVAACGEPSVKDDACASCPEGQGCGSGKTCRPLCVADYQCGACQACEGGVCVDATCVVPNIAPLADAGADQTVNKRAVIMLDATGSSDADGDALAYAWTQTSGTAVTLSDAAAGQPTFTAPTTTGALTFSLVVDDGEDSAGPDSVTINVQNGAPVANAGADQPVVKGSSAALNAGGSSDPDADPLTFSWTQTGGTTVSLSSTTIANPSFTAPLALGNLDFVVTVSDGAAAPVQDMVRIVVFDPIPIADAGDDGSVITGTVAELDGSGSHDIAGDSITYAWTQISGPGVTLLDDDTAQPSFAVPCGPGTLVFSLVVTDSQASSISDTVSLIVENRPLADAGSDQSTQSGEPVRLSAGPSCGARYRWTQIDGPVAQLDDPTSQRPRFMAPVLAPGPPTTFSFLLETELGIFSDQDTVSINVRGYSGSNAAVAQGNPFIRTYEPQNGPQAMEVNGSALYLAEYTYVEKVNLTIPSIPTQAALSAPGLHASDLAVANGFVYVANGDNGFMILDAGSLSSVGTCGVPGWSSGVAVEGDYAYVTSEQGLFVIDVSDPGSPSIVGGEALTDIYGVAVSGSFVYLAGYPDFRVFDVSDPSDPVPRDSVPSYTSDVEMLGTNHAIAAGSGLYIFDVTNPDAVTAELAPTDQNGSEVELDGDLAYMTVYGGGVVVYDLSTPSDPVLLGTYNTPQQATTAVAKSGILYVATSPSNVLQIIDAAQPSLTTYVDEYATLGYPFQIEVADGRIYVAEETRLSIFDAAALPDLVRTGGVVANLMGIAVRDGVLYGANGNGGGLTVYDVSGGADPMLLGFSDPIVGAYPSRVVVHDDRAFVVDQTNGLFIFDLSQPASPDLLTTYPVTDLQAVAVEGDTAYLALWNQGVITVDLNTTPPSFLDSMEGSQCCIVDLALRYPHAWGGTQNWQFLGIEMDTLDTFVDVSLSEPGPAVSLAGPQLWVANGSNGIVVYDVTQPSTPVLMGELGGVSWVRDVRRVDRYGVAINEKGTYTFDAEPQLGTRYDHGAAGAQLTYNVGWTDTGMPEPIQAECAVTGGSCAIGSLNQFSNVVQVIWTLPLILGDYEIGITLGTQRYFLSTKDRVTVP